MAFVRNLRLLPWPLLLTALLLLAGLGFAAPARAQDSSLPQLPPHAAPVQAVQTGALPVLDTTPPFDAEAATAAYLAKAGPMARERADSYSRGTVWLHLADVIWGLIVAGLLLWLQISAHIRDRAAAMTNSRAGRVMICAASYMVIAALAGLPLSIFQGFVREQAFGLSGQSLSGWLGHYALGFVLTLIAALIVLPLFYALIRRAGRDWWLWAAAATIAIAIPLAALCPVYVTPHLRHAAPLPDSPLKSGILKLAHANGVNADNVWLIDAASQPGRLAAHVSGLFGTTRIAINSNLYQQAGPDEVMALVGHELGHHVLAHRAWLLLAGAVLIVAGFGFIAWGFSWSTLWFGGAWQVREVQDVAGLPLLAAWGLLFVLLATPVTAAILRQCEWQADIFAVNAVRKPDAAADMVLKQAPRHGLDALPWVEAIFQTYQPGAARIHTLMVWKKAHIGDLDLRDSAAIPFQDVRH